MRWILHAAALVFLVVGNALGQSTNGRGGKLRMIAVDVEGGQATLFVTPAGQSLLIDTGWPGNDDRDANRIVAAARQAGLAKIDYVLISHYHIDHAGGIGQLVTKIPVGAVIDHGPTRDPDPAAQRIYATYEKTVATAKLKRIAVKPGDVLPVVGMKATVVSSDGMLLGEPLEGPGVENPFCKESEIRPEDVTENGRSIGVEIVFGKLRVLQLSGLTWDKERDLMCPLNKLGTVDLLMVSHPGKNPSLSPALVKAVKTRVAVMDNGAKKDGSVSILETLANAPGIEAIWQLHFSEDGGEDLNTADDYILNIDGADDGHALEITGSGDGSFDIKNSRTGVTKHYAARGLR